MKRTLFAALLAAAVPAGAQTSMTDSLTRLFEHSFDSLVQVRTAALDNLGEKAEHVALNPYYYRLMTPGTYYNRPLKEVFQIDWQPDAEAEPEPYAEAALDAAQASDHALAHMYVASPTLVSRTENSILAAPGFRQEATVTPVSQAPKLAEKAVAVDLGADVPDTIAVVAKKPNFWKIKGSASLQFTQSYFSDNWYQGGENNYAGIGMLTLEANYDNRQKLQWDNKLEAQLGFQTASSDTEHKVRVTSNLLRLTSKLGYKAAKNWFYTGQVMTYTQLAPYYEKNTKDWKANFATPLYLTLSVGMDYKYKSKDGRFDLSVYISPVAYYMTYVSKMHSGHLRDAADADSWIYKYPAVYGMEHPGDHFLHKWGPNLTVNSKVRVMKNVLWTSRLYWFSNFHSTLIEWENTLDFTINKYLSAKFYAYPRFDDSSWKYGHRDESKRYKAGYLMFKEWLSLGLSYNF